METFETIAYCVLILAYGAICYMAGKGDFLNLIPKLLLEKQQEIEKTLTQNTAKVECGQWILDQVETGDPFGNDLYTIDVFQCSVCGEYFDVSEARNYCPNCGADMRERKDQ